MYSNHPHYSNNSHYNNTEEPYQSQSDYPHLDAQSQDVQDTQGSIALSYPYLSSSYPYQNPGGMEQGTSAHQQDWHMYGVAGNDQQTVYSGYRTQMHEYREVNTTSPKAIEPYIIEHIDQGMKKFLCGWTGCTHAGKFVRKAQLQTHIKSVHLSEKPYICTACDASFTRRQDAARHVDTMNSGKQFKCLFCDDGFARKDYRDRHCERCKYR